MRKRRSVGTKRVVRLPQVLFWSLEFEVKVRGDVTHLLLYVAKGLPVPVAVKYQLVRAAWFVPERDATLGKQVAEKGSE